ncbi:Abi-alpha family protein [Prolixibacteraceae bacterium Z1-6]|uniref:Abi-alpha family protein n=1 Tax=Draconibacterium aestuarii TaxID=2998507 RepID=A0A9X3F2X7_9BACT|nr:Abi-alpha family protein [Prolixibacteraceae bacterium Z1-6]
MLEPESTQRAIEAVKPFLEKLVNPPLNELGLLFQDKVRLWRFNNQLKIVAKAQKMVEEHKIPVQPISLKILSPLLDMCSLEEDENLQDMWAHLLANYANKELHLKSTIFPYILSQLSSREAIVLNDNYQKVDLNNFEKKSSGNNSFELEEYEIMNLLRLRLLTEKYSTNVALASVAPGLSSVIRVNTQLTPLADEFLKACTKIRS